MSSHLWPVFFCAPSRMPFLSRRAECETRPLTSRPRHGRDVRVRRRIRHASAEVAKKLLAGEPVDPSQVYFKTVPAFETSAHELQWLTRAVFIGLGERQPDVVIVHVWKVE